MTRDTDHWGREGGPGEVKGSKSAGATTRPKTKKCPECNGEGYVTVKPPSLHDAYRVPDGLVFSTNQRCGFCEGKRRVSFDDWTRYQTEVLGKD